jgi:hypothetical protein
MIENFRHPPVNFGVIFRPSAVQSDGFEVDGDFLTRAWISTRSCEDIELPTAAQDDPLIEKAL